MYGNWTTSMKDYRSIKSVGVVGLGLIGASILKDLKKHAPHIVRYGHSNRSELKIAAQDQLVIPNTSLESLVNNCDLIFIATPIDSIPDIAKKISLLKRSKKHLIVADVASVKEQILSIFNELTSDTITYIPSHPMGGSERSGYQSSRGGLFRQKPWIICSSNDNQQSPQELKLAHFLKSFCGAYIHFIPYKKHDLYVASVSHMVLGLSNLLFEFVNIKHPEALTIAGESFITTTRLASDNPEMLANICQNNSNNIKPLFKEFLEFINNKVDDIESLDIDYFQNNKSTRDNWLHHRNKGTQ